MPQVSDALDPAKRAGNNPFHEHQLHRKSQNNLISYFFSQNHLLQRKRVTKHLFLDSEGIVKDQDWQQAANNLLRDFSLVRIQKMRIWHRIVLRIHSFHLPVAAQKAFAKKEMPKIKAVLTSECHSWQSSTSLLAFLFLWECIFYFKTCCVFQWSNSDFQKKELSLYQR